MLYCTEKKRGPCSSVALRDLNFASGVQKDGAVVCKKKKYTLRHIHYPVLVYNLWTTGNPCDYNFKCKAIL